MIDGAWEISPGPENFSVIRMVKGTEAPRAPSEASLSAPGCSKGAMLP